VRDWIARAPGWLHVRPANTGADDVAVAKLDEGERAVIALALAVEAELVLMEDREGVGIALVMLFERRAFRSERRADRT
jgi:predicted nucleic acid-binding protein